MILVVSILQSLLDLRGCYPKFLKQYNKKGFHIIFVLNVMGISKIKYFRKLPGRNTWFLNTTFASPKVNTKNTLFSLFHNSVISTVEKGNVSI